MEPKPIRHDDTGADSLSAPRIDYTQAVHIVSQVQAALDDEVASQNRAAAADRSEESRMREISNVANTMRAAIAALKQRAGNAVSTFQSEVKNTHSNLDKVDSVTSELKEANKEVEEMLGQSGSNFPPSSEDTGRPVDENGVWVNPEHKKNQDGLA